MLIKAFEDFSIQLYKWLKSHPNANEDWVRYTFSPRPDNYWDETTFRTHTTLDPKVLSWLEEVGFVSSLREARATITPAGVHRAKEILAKLRIKDWDREEVLLAYK